MSKSGQHQAQKQKKKQNKVWLWVVLGVVVLAVSVIIGVQTGKQAAVVMPDTVTVQDAQERFGNGAYLLDVREQSEWDAGHIEGAALIPLGQLAERASELPKDRDILIICRSGNRSGQARDLLRGMGFERTTSISGGITAWMAAGLPVVSGN